MKTPLRTLLLAAAATSALAAGPAQAGLITLTNQGIPYNETITLNNIDPDAPQSVYAGQNEFTTAADAIIYAWCIDVFHNISSGPGYVFNEGPFTLGATDNSASTVPPANLLTAGQISKMTGLFAIGDDILQDGELNQFNAHYHTAGTLDDWSAAIQLAVWDTEYAPNYSPTTGLDWSGGTAATQAIYTALVGDGMITGSNGFQLIGVNGQQSFGGPDAVPEPATLALLAVGLIGVGFARRRWGAAAI